MTFDADARPETVRHKITVAFKIKGGNAASDEKIAEVMRALPDEPRAEIVTPVTPAAEIRKHQASKND